MFPNITKQGLNIAKIINGLNKTVNIANQVIPLYIKAKPLITNATSKIDTLKTLLAPPPKPKQTIKKEEKITSSSNNPIFFL